MSKIRIAIPTTPDEGVENYVSALNKLDAEPVVVLPDGEEYKGLDCKTIDASDCKPSDFDAMLLPGGADIDPARYGQENTHCKELKPHLDALQFDIFERFLNAEKPILAICRGHQLVNVALGGTMLQDIEANQSAETSFCSACKKSGTDEVCHQRGIDIDEAAHLVFAQPGSCFEEIYGKEFAINSLHHQAIDKLADDLEPVLVAGDGVIEGCAHKSLPIITLQFHPERMCFDKARPDTVDGSLILKHFLETVKNTIDKEK